MLGRSRRSGLSRLLWSRSLLDSSGLLGKAGLPGRSSLGCDSLRRTGTGRNRLGGSRPRRSQYGCARTPGRLGLKFAWRNSLRCGLVDYGGGLASQGLAFDRSTLGLFIGIACAKWLNARLASLGRHASNGPSGWIDVLLVTSRRGGCGGQAVDLQLLCRPSLL